MLSAQALSRRLTGRMLGAKNLLLLPGHKHQVHCILVQLSSSSRLSWTWRRLLKTTCMQDVLMPHPAVLSGIAAGFGCLVVSPLDWLTLLKNNKLHLGHLLFGACPCEFSNSLPQQALQQCDKSYGPAKQSQHFSDKARAAIVFLEERWSRKS